MAESDLEKNAEFTQIFNKHGGDEDPIIAAQRFLNIFRQLHIFTPAKRKEFDELLLNQSPAVKGTFASLPGGSVLQEYVNNLEQNAGMKKTQAKIIATSPEISDEISKAKILASALAEAQAQMQSGIISDVNAQELDAVTSQLRKEMNRLKKDFQEIKENQTPIDISKLPAETLNQIQKSIERKISGGTFPSGLDTLKIVADESLKSDLVQIITQAIKDNADNRYIENRELAETLSESHIKMAELFADANVRTAEIISHAGMRAFDIGENNSDSFSDASPHYYAPVTSDNLGNILATVLKESNINSTQMLVDTLKSFQQENLKILEMQTELQKAMLDVSRSIHISKNSYVNDELNLESLDSDLENGVPAPVYLPEDKDKLQDTKPENESSKNEETKSQPSSPNNTASSNTSDVTNKNTSPEQSTTEDNENILTADDLFADLDEEKTSQSESSQQKKKKKKKKKKNKSDESTSPAPANTPKTKPSFYNNPLYQSNPLSNSTPSPFNAMFLNSPSSEIIQEPEEDSNWGFSSSKTVNEQNITPSTNEQNDFNSPQHFSNASLDESVPLQSNSQPQQEWEYVEDYNTDEDGQEWEYVEESDIPSQEQEWEYVEDTHSDSGEENNDWEWEYVEEPENGSQEQEWEYVEENTSENNDEDWEWEYVEEPENTDEATLENQSLPSDTESNLVLEDDEASSENVATAPSQSFDDNLSLNDNNTSSLSSSDTEQNNPEMEDVASPEGIEENNVDITDNNQVDEITSLDNELYKAPIEDISAKTSSTLKKEEIPEFQISGLSQTDDADPFATQ